MDRSDSWRQFMKMLLSGFGQCSKDAGWHFLRPLAAGIEVRARRQAIVLYLQRVVPRKASLMVLLSSPWSMARPS
jgi:hypothetical protein